MITTQKSDPSQISVIAMFWVFSTLLFSLSVPAIEFTPQEADYIARHNTVRVHNETDWPPFNYYENQTPQGISIDVMNLVAERTGLTVEYVTGPSWKQFMEMMESGQLDVMLNIVDLPERREKLKFTSSYVHSLTGIFTDTHSNNSVLDWNDLRGKVVAVPAGFVVEALISKYYPQIELLPVRDILECIEAVSTGKADAFVEQVGVVDYITSQRMLPNIQLAFPLLEKPFTTTLALATQKENIILHSILQKGLNAISGDEMNKIRKKWLLEANEIYEQGTVSLTVAEKEYLYEHNQFRICADPTWPPLDFINEDGMHSGLSADLTQKIAWRLNVSFKLVPTNTWKQSLQYVKEGKCDLIPLMNATEEASSYLDFTQPYFDFATVIVTRKGIPFIGDYHELHGKKVAMQAYYFLTEYVRENHPEIEIIEVENTIEALKLVSEHKAYATIDSLPTVVNTIEAMALENISIVGTVPQKNSMKAGVRKDHPMLFTILEKAIDSLSDKDKVVLYKKWLDIELESQFFNRSNTLKIGAGFLVLFALLLWRYYTLKRYTKQLQALNERLHHVSTIDHLTQVYNRMSIEKKITDEVAQSCLTLRPLSLVIFDIDHFKAINDLHGHIRGDEIIQEMAALVQGSIRQNSDYLGRWGGEEFVILLPGTTKDGAVTFIEKLRRKIETHDFGLEQPVTASFGIGEYSKEEDADKFLIRVDDYMYKAKNMGRNCLVFK